MENHPKLQAFFAEALIEVMEAGYGLKDRQPGEGWTTDELALELGVSRNTVSNWRNGTVPSHKNFQDLLKLFAPRGRRNAAAVRSRLEIAFSRLLN